MYEDIVKTFSKNGKMPFNEQRRIDQTTGVCLKIAAVLVKYQKHHNKNAGDDKINMEDLEKETIASARRLRDEILKDMYPNVDYKKDKEDKEDKVKDE